MQGIFHFPPFDPFLEYHKLLGELCKVALALGSQVHHILDPYSALAGNIYAGLDCYDIALLEGALICHAGLGVFMDVETEGMAEAVAEILAVARLGNNIPGGLVNKPALLADLKGFYTGQLGLKTMSYIFFISSVAYPTAKVLVMSEP